MTLTFFHPLSHFVRIEKSVPDLSLSLLPIKEVDDHYCVVQFKGVLRRIGNLDASTVCLCLILGGRVGLGVASKSF